MSGKNIHIKGRILYLTEDISLIERQLCGENLQWNSSIPLMDNISTDEITPPKVCFYYNEKLGDCVYTGLRGGIVQANDIKNNGFEVIVSGSNKGCGSSREMAPYAQKYAGIKIIIAKSFGKIYKQNCENIGLFVTTDFEILESLRKGEKIPVNNFLKFEDEITRKIILYGGLSSFNKERLKSNLSYGYYETRKRPKTIAEKIISNHIVYGKKPLKPLSSVFIKPDILFLHDFSSPMTFYIYKKELSEFPLIKTIPIYTFSDHLTFIENLIENKNLFLHIKKLKKKHEEIAEKYKTFHYGITKGGGAKAICHIAMIEDVVLPGQVVVGTDSHTSTTGALSTFSFGVGSTDMANALVTGDLRIKLPQSIKIILKGRLKKWTTAKDLILYILSMNFVKNGESIGKVFEFTGDGVSSLPIEERATICNMAVECGAFTAIFEPDERLVQFLFKNRKIERNAIEKLLLKSDKDAEYYKVLEINLSEIKPMVGMPFDPKNSIPLEELKEEIDVNIAYGGSCTGAKITDMKLYAMAIKKCLKKNLRCHPDVKFYIQFGSQKVKEYCKKKGYIKLFEDFGAILLEPGCGACIGAGYGISKSKEDVTVSAINRNYPGRSGPGKVFLTNPYEVVFSAMRKKLVKNLSKMV